MKLNLLFLIFCLGFLNLSAQQLNLIKDINLGAGNSVESWGTSFLQKDDKVFFMAKSDTVESALYVLKDGNISFLKTISVESSSSSQLILHDDKVYFIVKTQNSLELWSTDGTVSGTVKKYENSNLSSKMVSVGDKLYYQDNRGGDIYYIKSDGTSVKVNLNFYDVNLGFFNNSDNNFTLIDNDELIVVFNKFDSLFVGKLTDKVEILARGKFSIDGQKPQGLKKVNNGYIFMAKDKFFNVNKSNSVLREVNLTAINGSIGRIIEFKENQPLLLTSSGIFIMNNTTAVNVTKLSSIVSRVISNISIPKAIYNDKILLLTDDWNTSFSDYIFYTDGTISGTKELKMEISFSNIVQNSMHAVFATQIGSFDNPIVYYFNLENGEERIVTEFRNFSNSSGSPKIIPIGLQGREMYCFSTFNSAIGRELYRFDIGINTFTDEFSPQNNKYTLHKTNGQYKVFNHDRTHESLFITFVGVEGRILKQFNHTTEENFDSFNNNQILFIYVEGKNKSVFKVFD